MRDSPSAHSSEHLALRAKAEKTAAKNAMMVCMGGLVLTGYLAACGGRRDTAQARLWHMVAGVGLLGTSYWHHTLYGRAQRTPRQTERPAGRRSPSLDISRPPVNGAVGE